MQQKLQWTKAEDRGNALCYNCEQITYGFFLSLQEILKHFCCQMREYIRLKNSRGKKVKKLYVYENWNKVNSAKTRGRKFRRRKFGRQTFCQRIFRRTKTSLKCYFRRKDFSPMGNFAERKIRRTGFLSIRIYAEWKFRRKLLIKYFTS